MSRKKLNVLFLNHELSLGGAEIMLLKFFQHYDKEKFNCMLLLPDDGLLAEEARKSGVDVDYFHIPEELLSIRRGRFGIPIHYVMKLMKVVRPFREMILSKKPDIVVSNSIKAHVLGSLALYNSQVKYYWRLHDIIDDQSFSLLQRKFLYYLAKHIPKKISTVSCAVNKPLIKIGVSESKLRCIYNGVEIPSLFNEEDINRWRADLNLEPNDFVITLPGRIVPMKGHETLIRASKSIVSKFKHVKFLIVGDAPSYEKEYANYLRQLIFDLGLQIFFKFTFYRNDMSKVYSISDVVVHLSNLPDSLPTVILEGMAAGKILIATKIGGVEEIISDGIDGFLIEPNDETALSKKIIEIINNPDRFNQMKQKAVEKIKSKFLLSTYISSMEQWLS